MSTSPVADGRNFTKVPAKFLNFSFYRRARVTFARIRAIEEILDGIVARGTAPPLHVLGDRSRMTVDTESGHRIIHSVKRIDFISPRSCMHPHVPTAALRPPLHVPLIAGTPVAR